MDKYDEAARIEDELALPADVVDPTLAYIDAQDAARGDWASPRDTEQPRPPWPSEDNTMLQFLLHKAKASLDAGMDPMAAVLQASAHAWFEGGIESFDRAMVDGRRPRLVP